MLRVPLDIRPSFQSTSTERGGIQLEGCIELFPGPVLILANLHAESGLESSNNVQDLLKLLLFDEGANLGNFSYLFKVALRESDVSRLQSIEANSWLAASETVDTEIYAYVKNRGETW